MRSQRVSRERVFMGAVLILLGVAFLLGTLGILDVGDTIGNLWPVLIILFGAVWLVSRWPQRIAGPVIVIVIGAILLVTENQWIEGLDFGDLWPVLLIAIGLLVLLGALQRTGQSRPGDVGSTSRAGAVPQGPAEDVVDQFAFFGGAERKVTSGHFRGGRATAFFGGVDLDLREATLAPEGAVLDATTAFGGIDVKVPPDWSVAVEGTAILGGFSDERKDVSKQPNGAPVLVVKGLAALGAVSVKTR